MLGTPTHMVHDWGRCAQTAPTRTDRNQEYLDRHRERVHDVHVDHAALPLAQDRWGLVVPHVGFERRIHHRIRSWLREPGSVGDMFRGATDLVARCGGSIEDGLAGRGRRRALLPVGERRPAGAQRLNLAVKPLPDPMSKVPAVPICVQVLHQPAHAMHKANA